MSVKERSIKMHCERPIEALFAGMWEERRNRSKGPSHILNPCSVFVLEVDFSPSQQLSSQQTSPRQQPRARLPWRRDPLEAPSVLDLTLATPTFPPKTHSYPHIHCHPSHVCSRSPASFHHVNAFVLIALLISRKHNLSICLSSF